MKRILRQGLRWSRRMSLAAGIVRLPHRSLEDHILSVYLYRTLQKYDVDCVIDVGANHGQFALSLRSDLDYRGPIVSFEPGSETFRQLNEVLSSETGIETRHCAIGAENTQLELNVMEMDVLNSFHTPRQKDVEITPNRVVKTETVPVFRLDYLAQEIAPLRQAQRLLLKTDTQGFDLEVIAGAEGILDRAIGLLVEMPFTRIYEEAPTYHDVIEALDKKGFHLAAMAPSGVVKDRIVDVDALFINDRFAR